MITFLIVAALLIAAGHTQTFWNIILFPIQPSLESEVKRQIAWNKKKGYK